MSVLGRILPLLQCPVCRDSAWERPERARITCTRCGASHDFRDGVLWFDLDSHADVTQERAAVAGMEMQPALGGWCERVDDSAQVDEGLKGAYLSLPHGDGSFRFEQPGYFFNVRRFAPEFDFVTALIGRFAAGNRLLDLGADGTWSTARLADQGFDCIALDITDHLRLSHLYHTDRRRYAAVNVDMHEAVFRPDSFDVITAFNALHHSTRLNELTANISRMLKPGGVLGFVEPYIQNEQQSAAFGAPQSAAGINENVHSLDRWHAALRSAGLALRGFALSDSFNAVYQKSPNAGHPPANRASSATNVGPSGTNVGRPLTGCHEVAPSDDPWSDIYQARLSLSPTAAAVPVGVPAAFDVEITNQAIAGWASRGPEPIRLSYHVSMKTPDGAVLVSFDNDRTLLPTFIAPGATEVLRVPVTLATPGVYEIEFDLVHEARTWFKDRGARTAIAILTVVAPS